MEYNEIIASFVTKREHSKSIEKANEAKIAEAQEAARRYHALMVKKYEQIQKLKQASWHNRVSWVSEVVIPLVKEVNRRLGTRFETKDLRTYGLRAECTVFQKEEMSLTFTPYFDGDTFRLFLDTGKKGRKCEPGSIAELNGMDNISEEINSVEQVIENLKRRFPDII